MGGREHRPKRFFLHLPPLHTKESARTPRSHMQNCIRECLPPHGPPSHSLSISLPTSLVECLPWAQDLLGGLIRLPTSFIMSETHPLDIPSSAYPVPATYNTPTASNPFISAKEFPFGRPQDLPAQSLDFAQLSKHLQKIEMSRLGDDLAFALGAY